MKLTPEEKQELAEIMFDKNSKGAFCGMCSNLYFGQNTKEGCTPIGYDTIIHTALKIRSAVTKLALENKPLYNSLKQQDCEPTKAKKQIEPELKLEM